MKILATTILFFCVSISSYCQHNNNSHVQSICNRIDSAISNFKMLRTKEFAGAQELSVTMSYIDTANNRYRKVEYVQAENKITQTLYFEYNKLIRVALTKKPGKKIKLLCLYDFDKGQLVFKKDDKRIISNIDIYSKDANRFLKIPTSSHSR